MNEKNIKKLLMEKTTIEIIEILEKVVYQKQRKSKRVKSRKYLN